MKIADICSRDVYVVTEQEPLPNAVREMDGRHIGAVVVVDREGMNKPVGIVTDRDVLRGQLDRQSDMFCLTVGDVMTRRPLVLLEDCDAATAVDRMSAQVVRRAPVVDQEGHLVGIVSFDDLLPAVAAQISTLARLIGTQASREAERQR